MLDTVRAYATRHALWSPHEGVLAAVSGGGDSVGLAMLLSELAASGEVVLAGVGHVHHHIRAGEADEDERFCRDLAERLAVPFAVSHVDAPALAVARGGSVEVAARDARRSALRDQAARLGASLIATAHTADDQAETVLLRLVRGAGLTGLSAIAPRRDGVVRPLLEVRREAVRAWLRDRGERWREDGSNTDVRHPRNRVRHELLPYLRQHFNPAVDIALTRLADAARADDTFLQSSVERHVEALVTADEGGVTVATRGVAALPLALARRVARAALESALPSRSYDLREVDLLHHACLSGASRPFDLKGLRIERTGPDSVSIHRRLAPAGRAARASALGTSSMVVLKSRRS